MNSMTLNNIIHIYIEAIKENFKNYRDYVESNISQYGDELTRDCMSIVREYSTSYNVPYDRIFSMIVDGTKDDLGVVHGYSQIDFETIMAIYKLYWNIINDGIDVGRLQNFIKSKQLEEEKIFTEKTNKNKNIDIEKIFYTIIKSLRFYNCKEPSYMRRDVYISGKIKEKIESNYSRLSLCINDYKTNQFITRSREIDEKLYKIIYYYSKKSNKSVLTQDYLIEYFGITNKEFDKRFA